MLEFFLSCPNLGELQPLDGAVLAIKLLAQTAIVAAGITGIVAKHVTVSESGRRRLTGEGRAQLFVLSTALLALCVTEFVDLRSKAIDRPRQRALTTNIEALKVDLAKANSRAASAEKQLKNVNETTSKTLASVAEELPTRRAVEGAWRGLLASQKISVTLGFDVGANEWGSLELACDGANSGGPPSKITFSEGKLTCGDREADTASIAKAYRANGEFLLLVIRNGIDFQSTELRDLPSELGKWRWEFKKLENGGSVLLRIPTPTLTREWFYSDQLKLKTLVLFRGQRPPEIRNLQVYLETEDASFESIPISKVTWKEQRRVTDKTIYETPFYQLKLHRTP